MTQDVPMTTIDLGRVLELSAGEATARIYPDQGGRLGQLTVGGIDLLRGPDSGAAEGWGFWGSYPLLPWCNRIPGGRFCFEGEEHQVAVNWSDGTAIHGLTADVPWRVVAQTETALVVEVEAEEGPYDVVGRQRFDLTPTHLDLRLEIVNEGGRVPVGLGIHPWFVAGLVQLPAGMTWPGDTPLPTGPPRPVDGGEDLRAPAMPPPMDRCYTGLTGTSARVGPLTLSWSGPVTQIVVYSEHEGFVCVEPVTMANDGFGLLHRGVAGTGVFALDPGGTAAVDYRFAW